jgi:large subunit ribosomal protein L21
MNFAVVEIAGKQFLVQENEIIETPKLSGVTGDQVSFPRVLLYWDGEKASIGRPILEGFSVEGRIVKFDKYEKIVVFKFKRRKDSHRKRGHRQDFCAVAIEKIIIPGKADTPKEEEKSAAAKKKKPAVKKTSPSPAKEKEKKASAKKPAAPKKPAAKKKSPEKD